MREHPLRVAVLASGRGSNLATLIAARNAGQIAVEFVAVGSDKPDAPALRLAAAADIPTFALQPSAFPSRADFDRAVFARLGDAGAELVVLAGFMRVLDGDAIAPWAGRIINIHPSLLPKYRGLHTHRRALEAGDSDHGASVHVVSAELDGGPLIAQVHVPIEAGDDEDTLAARLLVQEHRLLPAVVAAIAAGRIRCEGGRVLDHGVPLAAPLLLDAAGALVAA